MVVCQGQLDSIVPEPATMSARVVVQWDKDDCSGMGIVKLDLLGLGMMAVLEDCLELIPKHYRKPVDLAQLPADDPAVTQQRASYWTKVLRSLLCSSNCVMVTRRPRYRNMGMLLEIRNVVQ